MVLLLALLLVNLKLVTAIPDGFILHVQPACGNGNDGTYALITVKSDLVVKIDAVCGSGSTGGEISGNGVQADIKVYYGTDTGSTGNCYFKNPDQDSGLSTVKLKMYWGNNEDNLMSGLDTYSVTCLSEASKKSDSVASSKSEGFNPNDIIEYQGSTFSNTVVFHIVDINDKIIDGETVPLGRLVQLRSTLTGSTVTTVQVVDCFANGKDNNATSFQILKAGCGDGVVFRNSMGFTTSSGVSRSPYFKMFKVDQDSGLEFSCTFTDCVSSCDGSSCTNAARKKRSDVIENHETKAKYVFLDGQTDDVVRLDNYMIVKSQSYTISRNEHQNKLVNTSVDISVSRQWIIMMISSLGTLSLLSMTILIYMCVRKYKRLTYN